MSNAVIDLFTGKAYIPSAPKKRYQPKKIGGFVYRVKSRAWKCSNLEFNEETETAYSYDWYEIFKKLGPIYVLNTYNYSSSTIKHYHKLRWFLPDYGIPEFIEIEAPLGLQRLDAAIELYQDRIKELQALIDKPRSHKHKNVERLVLISKYNNAISTIKTLERYA